MNNNSDSKKPTGYILHVATFINWTTRKGVYGYNILSTVDDSIFYRDFICDYIESSSQGEMKALIVALDRVPIEKPVLIKTSQSVIVVGINYGLDYWVQQNWVTREGHQVKSQDEWEKIHRLIHGREIFALQVQDEELSNLQNTCKQYLMFLEN